MPHRVLIIGGGFGGLHAAKRLRRAPVEVKLADRRNFHLFQPLLYQVATGGLSPADICAPLRAILKRQPNCQVLLAEARGFDLSRRRVFLADGQLDYDTLVVAAGGTHSYFGNDHWAERAPGLKTVEDATEIRRRMLLAFEAAEREGNPRRVRQWLTFVVVGGGPTGVELAGALSEIARDTLRRDFRSIDPAHARILLVEAAGDVLPSYPGKLPRKARSQLETLGVEVRLSTPVTDIQDDSVGLRSGDRTETIPCRTVLWGAGVKASRLGPMLAEAGGAETDRAGRVLVEPDLTLPGRPDVFVIGDLARRDDQEGKPLPGVAPVAIQQGNYVARLIRRRLEGRTMPPFCYRDLGMMATIGRHRAVAVVGPLRLSGLPAWLAWLFVHLDSLVLFRDRISVLFEWAYNYFTWNRAGRLITGPSPFPLPIECHHPTLAVRDQEQTAAGV